MRKAKHRIKSLFVVLAAAMLVVAVPATASASQHLSDKETCKVAEDIIRESPQRRASRILWCGSMRINNVRQRERPDRMYAQVQYERVGSRYPWVSRGSSDRVRDVLRIPDHR